MGHTPSWSDLMFASELAWFRVAWGEDSAEWEDVLSWHGGRWEFFLENMKEYETVV